MTETYRLPNDEVTVDAGEYVEAWGIYGKAVPELFPGYRVIAYDPGVLIGGSNPYRPSVSLPLFVLDLLLRQRARLDELENATPGDEDDS